MAKIVSEYEVKRDSSHLPMWWHSKNNQCPAHFHRALEICVVKSGSLDVFINGEKHQAAAGNIIVIPCHAVHRFVATERNNTLMLIIPTDYIVSFGRLLSTECFSKHIIPSGNASRAITRCLLTLFEQPPPVSDTYIIRGQIYTILGILLEQLPRTPIARSNIHLSIQDILSYLHQNFRESITLKIIAADFGYSASRISHMFNKNVGCTIPEYLNTLRARDAARKLIDTEKSITSIAMESGFESMRTFYRAFKSSFAMTPLCFLKLSKGTANALLNQHY